MRGQKLFGISRVPGRVQAVLYRDLACGELACSGKMCPEGCSCRMWNTFSSGFIPRSINYLSSGKSNTTNSRYAAATNISIQTSRKRCFSEWYLVNGIKVCGKRKKLFAFFVSDSFCKVIYTLYTTRSNWWGINTAPWRNRASVCQWFKVVHTLAGNKNIPHRKKRYFDGTHRPWWCFFFGGSATRSFGWYPFRKYRFAD